MKVDGRPMKRTRRSTFRHERITFALEHS
jgi:hypothetical protein